MKTPNRISLVILLGLFIGCSLSPTVQLEKNKEVIRQLIEAINTRNYDLLDEIVAPDFVRHCQATPDVHVKSRDELKQFLQQDLEVFPDSRISMEMIIAEGDMIAGYFMFSGTQEGAIGPFPATGKKAEVKYLSILRLEAGKIAEMWVEWDNLAILSQLGHWPPKEKSEE
ncbi:MAG: ester cyclase [Candidatus Glassbacteria bacterium]